MTLSHTNIMNTDSNRNDSYHLRLAAFEEAYDIWSVMDTCYQALEHKEYFICDDLDYVKDILAGHGFGVVACNEDDKIVGNLLVKYPGLSEENLGYDVFIKEYANNCISPDCNITLTSKTLNQVLHMDSTSVLPEHRGHGLENKMITFAESLIDTSQYCYSFATVSPNNHASLKSLEKNGYQTIVTKEKYAGFMRYIMLKILE